MNFHVGELVSVSTIFVVYGCGREGYPPLCRVMGVEKEVGGRRAGSLVRLAGVPAMDDGGGRICDLFKAQNVQSVGM